MKIEINTAQQINIYVLQSYEAKKKKNHSLIQDLMTLQIRH